MQDCGETDIDAFQSDVVDTQANDDDTNTKGDAKRKLPRTRPAW
jgi:hypothetical protein